MNKIRWHALLIPQDKLTNFFFIRIQYSPYMLRDRAINRRKFLLGATGLTVLAATPFIWTGDLDINPLPETIGYDTNSFGEVSRIAGYTSISFDPIPSEQSLSFVGDDDEYHDEDGVRNIFNLNLVARGGMRPRGSEVSVGVFTHQQTSSPDTGFVQAISRHGGADGEIYADTGPVPFNNWQNIYFEVPYRDSVLRQWFNVHDQGIACGVMGIDLDQPVNPKNDFWQYMYAITLPDAPNQLFGCGYSLGISPQIQETLQTFKQQYRGDSSIFGLVL